MRSFALVMVFGGGLLFVLAAYSQIGYLNKADQVADVLAMGTSLLVSISGLIYLMVTRSQPIADAITPAQRGQG